jgi:hypothetical protein
MLIGLFNNTFTTQPARQQRGILTAGRRGGRPPARGYPGGPTPAPALSGAGRRWSTARPPGAALSSSRSGDTTRQSPYSMSLYRVCPGGRPPARRRAPDSAFRARRWGSRRTHIPAGGPRVARYSRTPPPTPVRTAGRWRPAPGEQSNSLDLGNVSQARNVESICETRPTAGIDALLTTV